VVATSVAGWVVATSVAGWAADIWVPVRTSVGRWAPDISAAWAPGSAVIASAVPAGDSRIIVASRASDSATRSGTMTITATISAGRSIGSVRADCVMSAEERRLQSKGGHASRQGAGKIVQTRLRASFPQGSLRHPALPARDFSKCLPAMVDARDGRLMKSC